MTQVKPNLEELVTQIRACTECATDLSHGVRPVLQVSPTAKILVAGQAPGSKVHASGVPFDDASGERLRDWMGVDKSVFYDPSKIAILPMGFCYPGTGKSGDLAPRKECAPLWRQSVLDRIPSLELTLVIGMYAMHWHLPELKREPLTHTVKNWRDYWPDVLPLPHPSPRNNIWLKKNPWFADDVLPSLQQRIRETLTES